MSMTPRFYVQESVVMVYENNSKTVSSTIMTNDKEIQPHQVDSQIKRMVQDAQTRNRI